MGTGGRQRTNAPVLTREVNRTRVMNRAARGKRSSVRSRRDCERHRSPRQFHNMERAGPRLAGIYQTGRCERDKGKRIKSHSGRNAALQPPGGGHSGSNETRNSLGVSRETFIRGRGRAVSATRRSRFQISRIRGRKRGLSFLSDRFCFWPR